MWNGHDSQDLLAAGSAEMERLCDLRNSELLRGPEWNWLRRFRGPLRV